MEPVLTALDEVRVALLIAIHRTKQESGSESLCDNSDEAQDVLIPVGDHNAAEQHTAIPDIPAVVLSEKRDDTAATSATQQHLF